MEAVTLVAGATAVMTRVDAVQLKLERSVRDNVVGRTIIDAGASDSRRRIRWSSEGVDELG